MADRINTNSSLHHRAAAGGSIRGVRLV